MTICIAAIHSNEAIITASDKKISFSGYFSTEGELSKFIPMQHWIGLMAGEDISPAMPILYRIANTETGEETVEEYAALCRKSYLQERVKEIESRVLSKYDMTMDAFKKTGKAIFTDKVYEHVFQQIEEFEMSCSFLFAGFDKSSCAPHIFRLCDPGRTETFDRTGYWAIGTGKHAAISHLASYPYQRTDSLGVCICRVMAAKIAAETARDVGKDTYVSLKFRGVPGSIDLAPDLLDALRKGYESLPRLPLGIDTLVQVRVEKTKKYLLRQLRDIKEPVRGTGMGITTLPENFKERRRRKKAKPVGDIKPREAEGGKTVN